MCPAARDRSRVAFAKSSAAGRESATGGRETSTDSSTGEASRGSVNPSWSCRPATQKNSRPGCGPWASAWPWPRSRSPVRVWRRSGGRVPSMLDDAEWERLSTLYNGWIDDVADVLQGLATAAQDAERSVEGPPIARAVVADLRTRIEAAIGELIDRTNTLTDRKSTRLNSSHTVISYA